MSPFVDFGLLPSPRAVRFVAAVFHDVGWLVAHPHSAIVAGENQKRVFRRTATVERFEHLADRPIQFVYEISVNANLARAAKALMWL